MVPGHWEATQNMEKPKEKRKERKKLGFESAEKWTVHLFFLGILGSCKGVEKRTDKSGGQKRVKNQRETQLLVKNRQKRHILKGAKRNISLFQL